jgi:hypothetical protein
MVIAYGIVVLLKTVIPISLLESYLYVALPISGVIASVVTYLFHKKAVRNAEEFLLKTEA